MTVADIYLVAPMTQPSIQSEILARVSKRVHDKDQKHGESNKAYSMIDSERAPADPCSNIVRNPLLYHGFEARQYLKGLFAQIEFA